METNQHIQPDYIEHPESLLVSRNGFLDEAYYDAIYRAKRRAAVVASAKHLMHETVSISGTVGVNVGRGLLYLLTPEHLRPVVK